MHRGEEGGNQSQLEREQENILLREWEESQQSQKDKEGGVGTMSKVVTDFLRIQFAYWKGSKGIN